MVANLEFKVFLNMVIYKGQNGSFRAEVSFFFTFFFMGLGGTFEIGWKMPHCGSWGVGYWVKSKNNSGVCS